MLNHAYKLGALVALEEFTKASTQEVAETTSGKDGPLIELLVSKLEDLDNERKKRMQGKDVGKASMREIESPVMWGAKHIVSKTPADA